MMSPPRTTNLSAILAVLFLLLASSAVLAYSDLPQFVHDSAPDLLESDPHSSSAEIALSNPKPQSEDSEIVSMVEFKPQDAVKTIDLKADALSEPLTLVDFALVNRHWPGRFRHPRGCGHSPRFKPQDRKREISYGNDMIASDERTGPNSEISSVEFDPHQHGPSFVFLDEAEFKGPRHHHHDDDNDDEEHGLKSFQKFSWVYADKHTPRELERSHDHDADDEHEHKHGFLKKIKELFDEDDDDDDEHERFKYSDHGHGPHGHHHKRPPFHERQEDGEDHHHHHRHGHDHHEHEHNGGLMIMQKLRKFLDHF